MSSRKASPRFGCSSHSTIAWRVQLLKKWRARQSRRAPHWQAEGRKKRKPRVYPGSVRNIRNIGLGQSLEPAPFVACSAPEMFRCWWNIPEHGFSATLCNPHGTRAAAVFEMFRLPWKRRNMAEQKCSGWFWFVPVVVEQGFACNCLILMNIFLMKFNVPDVPDRMRQYAQIADTACRPTQTAFNPPFHHSLPRLANTQQFRGRFSSFERTLRTSIKR